MCPVIENEMGFDLKLAVECADSFSASTGLGVSVSDYRGHVYYETGISCKKCAVCRLIEAYTNEPLSCTNAHIYGMMQAERFGGKYIYFCPAGLTCITTPIVGNYGAIAYITAGPFLMVDKEDYLKYDACELLKLPPQALSEMEKLVKDIPFVEPSVINKLSSLLFMATGFISSSYAARELVDKKNGNEIQNYIGEFILSLKSEEDASKSDYPFEKENELLGAIVDGNPADASRLLNELLGHIFFKSGGDFSVIKTRVTELVVLLSRAAVEGGADSDHVFGLNHACIAQINDINNLESLCVWLSSIINKFTDHVFRFKNVKHIDIIRKAIEYIRRNYMKKLTLEDVACAVYLSPSYFSKIFKEEVNQNFSNYLNSVRIEKSKKLLLSGTVRTIDIPGMVGFEDQSYFSKVFKKLTGVTPGKYREARGQIRASGSEEDTLNLNE